MTRRPHWLHFSGWRSHWLELLLQTMPPFATSLWLEPGLDNGLPPAAFGVHTTMVLNITAAGYMESSVVWMATSCIFSESWHRFIFIGDIFGWSLQNFFRKRSQHQSLSRQCPVFLCHFFQPLCWPRSRLQTNCGVSHWRKASPQKGWPPNASCCSQLKWHEDQ